MSKVKTTDELLMMFIRDIYKSPTGKVSKSTGIAAMHYVAGDPELQSLVNSSDWKAVAKHKAATND